MNIHSSIESAMINVNKKDEDAYKLGFNSHIAFKNPQSFRKFYSGGPPKSTRSEPFYVRRLGRR